MLCLTYRTSSHWVEAALADIDAVLVDHAHCEMKAASNALSLAVRASATPGVVRELVALAEEELSHFRRVFAELERRAIPLGPPPEDLYAGELRRRVCAERARGPEARRRVPEARRRGPEDVALVDRLLVAALIEARSCERFRLLSDALRERGPEPLHALYRDLLAAEARHFGTFFDLARQVAPSEGAWIEARLVEVARLEGELVSELVGAPAIHG